MAKLNNDAFIAACREWALYKHGFYSARHRIASAQHLREPSNPEKEGLPMSACPPLTYTNVPASVWTKIKAAVLADYGVVISADEGTASGDGFELSWAYAGGGLTITCLDSPFWAACSMINGQIDGLVKPFLSGV